MRWQRKRASAACTQYWVLCQQHAGTGPVHGRRLAHGLRVLSRGLQRRGETGRTDGGGPRRFVESFCKFTDALLVGFPPSRNAHHLRNACLLRGRHVLRAFRARASCIAPVVPPSTRIPQWRSVAPPTEQQQRKKRSHASARATSVQAPAHDVAPGRIPGRHRLQPHRTAPAL